MKSNLSISTLCIHAGTILSDEDTGVNSPIYPSSAFRYETDGEPAKYPRYLNIPNQEAVAKKICALEKTESAIVLGTGMAAISAAIMGVVKAGEHIVFQSNLYGGTHFFIAEILEKFGVEYSLIHGNKVEDFEKEIQANTKLIYIETPSNPLLEITDIEHVVAIAKKYDVLTMIDNTFATPINQRPVEMGVDIVIHSATKYMGGHSDLMAGIIATSNKIMESIKVVAINLGGTLDARVCYLLERSMKTLALRMKQHNENALKIAQFLEKHPKITAVNYPGLASHPQHELAKKQMVGFGGMLSFEVSGGWNTSLAFTKKLILIPKALSLGGV
ncbi:MAG: cystathionine beta-lyase, partial [Arenicella sp.]